MLVKQQDYIGTQQGEDRGLSAVEKKRIFLLEAAQLTAKPGEFQAIVCHFLEQDPQLTQALSWDVRTCARIDMFCVKC